MSLQIDYEKEMEKLDLTAQPPLQEPQRQYYYIKKCRHIVSKLAAQLGRPLTASTVTFGCPKNNV